MTGQPRHGEFASETVRLGNASRLYRLVVPSTVDLNQPAPLVIAFHGMLIDSKDVMPLYTQLNQTAQQHRFILVYPEAIAKSWGIAPKKVSNDQDPIFPIAIARENRDKYLREGHQVEYIEVAGLGHEWATRVNINDRIWNFFAR